MHQIETAHWRLQGRCQRYRTRVVDAEVDAAEFLRTRGDRRLDGLVVANIANDWQCLAAGLLDFLRRRINSTRQLRVRLRGLGRDDDIGTVLRGTFCDSQSNAATAAADEHRFSVQVTHGALRRFFRCIIPQGIAAEAAPTILKRNVGAALAANDYILKIPCNDSESRGLFIEADIPCPRIPRVSTGYITPSSQSRALE